MLGNVPVDGVVSDHDYPPRPVIPFAAECRGLTMTELSRRCEMSPGALADLVSGRRRLRQDTARRIAFELGVDQRVVAPDFDSLAASWGDR